jgi:hypothetical protein
MRLRSSIPLDSGEARRRALVACLWLGVGLLVLLGLASRLNWPFAGVALSHPPGVLIPDAPVQFDLDDAAPFEFGRYRLTPRAGFRLDARVLGRAVYRFDAGARLSPVDLHLGWHRMSDSAVIGHFRFSQRWRWAYWRARELPIPEREIIASQSNMHMIPADREIERRLRRLRTGELVRIEGLLVDARRDDGWSWNTSLSRTDTGDGACELVWVTALSVLPAGG